MYKKSKEDGKHQELILSNTKPDPGHRTESEKKTQEVITFKRAKRPALSHQVIRRLQSIGMTVWHRQTQIKTLTKETPPWNCP